MTPKPAAIPEGICVYAIGDIHGRADLLEQLVEKIRVDSATHAKENIIVFLGDYVDRGSDSKAVIDYLLNLNLPRATHVFLRGNHEERMLDFVSGNLTGAESWLFQYGGAACLASYGVDVFRAGARNDLAALTRSMAESLPETHRRFLENARSFYACGDYYFAHAGVNPDYPLDNQRPEDLLWIRQPFLSSRKNFGKIIVHGHSITDEPEIHENRIGIDTGAYATGCLTCLKLWQTERRFLATTTT